MLSSKQRAKLRSIGNDYETILQVGKNGVVDTVITQVDDALNARELIKVRVLETSPSDVRDVANEIATKTNADVVQVIGGRFLLYRMNKKDSKIKV